MNSKNFWKQGIEGESINVCQSVTVWMWGRRSVTQCGEENCGSFALTDRALCMWVLVPTHRVGGGDQWQEESVSLSLMDQPDQQKGGLVKAKFD